MNIPDKKYDIVIIGSGLGGLLCGFILAREGRSVCILEQNTQLGGNLQVFSRDKCVFDTGVHYIGSLDEGQNLHQFFKYFGLLDHLKLKRMDDEGYDMIRFGDGKGYMHGQGYTNFIKNLVKDFPDEVEAIHAFCNKVQDVCRCFPLYNLEVEMNIDYFLSNDVRELNAQQYIASLTKNVRLQNVLAGSNPLYAGVREKTPFYVHALILNSYILGSYRLKDGGSQIAKYLATEIRKMGGELYKRKKVIGANYHDNGKVSDVVLETGERVKGENFISNIHPSVTIDLFGEERFLSAYRKRVKSLENTMSSFTLHIVFKKNTFKYFNYNIYQYHVEDVWEGTEYKEATWPEGYFVCTPATSKSDVWAESMCVMTYMRYEETAKWAKTYNTTAHPNDRGAEYEAFKKHKEELLLNKLEELFPGLREKIKSVYSSTPLTFRDYIGDVDGSLYGILKDCNNPLRSSINAKTKVPNLYLTGQNLIFHGVLGVTIGAFITCFEFIDKKLLIDKVKNCK